MAHKFFYSWQDDRSGKTGRYFILKALKAAVEKLTKDVTVESVVRDEGMEVDQDTQGVPGTPPIMDHIYRKIDSAAAFIADMTFVGMRCDGRPTPNPNVLIEYGWALKSLTYSRVICVMNSAHGEPTQDSMPFDLKHARFPMQYNLPDDANADAREAVMEDLSNRLAKAIRTILESPEFKSSRPVVPPPPAFPAASPKVGAARFRTAQEPIGFTIGHGPISLGGGRAVSLEAGPAMWLRVMPVSALSTRWLGTEIQRLAHATIGSLFPLGNDFYTGYDFVLAEDGFGLYGLSGKQVAATGSVAFVFESGEIWAVDTISLQYAGNSIPPFEGMFVQALERYADFLRKQLGVSGDLRWIAGMEGVKGRSISAVDPRRALPGAMQLQSGIQPRGLALADLISEQGLHPSDAKAEISLKPFFRLVYARCAVQSPPWAE